MAIASGQPILASDVGQFRGTQAGPLSVTFTASATASGSVVYTTAFAVVPNVTCQIFSGAGAAVKSTTLITASTATGFTVRVDLVASASLTLTVYWQAILT